MGNDFSRVLLQSGNSASYPSIGTMNPGMWSYISPHMHMAYSVFSLSLDVALNCTLAFEMKLCHPCFNVLLCLTGLECRSESPIEP